MYTHSMRARRKVPLTQPLAERVRPRTLEEFIGQTRLVGEGTLLRGIVESDKVFSLILWGPPGCGKTTCMLMCACECVYAYVYIHISAYLNYLSD